MDIEQFIEDIRRHPELYEKGNKNYMNQNEKEKIWKYLGETHQVDAKKKWNSLRDKYVREKKKLEAPSGSAAKEGDMWELFPLLAFLNESIKPRRMKENRSSGCSNLEEDFIQENLTCEPDDPASAINLDAATLDSSLPSSTSSAKRRRGREADEQVDKAIMATLAAFSEKLKENNEENEDSLFLKSIEKKMKQMTEDEKVKFKIEILMKATEAVKNSAS